MRNPIGFNRHVASISLTLVLLECCNQANTNQTNDGKPLNYVYWRNATQRALGSVIPWPREIKILNRLDFLAIEVNNFKLTLKGTKIEGCEIIKRAVERYRNRLLFDDRKPEDKDDPDKGQRKQIGTLNELKLTEDRSREFRCESIPHEEMDENYHLHIMSKPTYINTGDREELIWNRSDLDAPTARLSAGSSWGLIRGLETLSQLVFNAGPNKFAVRQVAIDDGPRFKHRGFMLDTARHYVSKPNILALLDAMAYNKLNVFHWHMVDDQSFPYESSTYPRLSQQTSFRPEMVYRREDISDVIEYAAERGIRVMPELDTPGHSYAMRSIKNFLTKCYDEKTKQLNGDFGPVDPTSSSAYRTMFKMVSELSSLFPDAYFHAGGDEVDYDCWRSNPQINKWMESKNMTSGDYQQLSSYYIRKISDILVHHNRTGLFWQEVFDDGTNLPKESTVIHVWKDINNPQASMKELNRVVRAGYKALLSSCWYLNYIDYGQDWIKFYQCDPASGPIRREDEHLVLGGEVCMWTEFVDDSNVVSRTWPRASAAAERLWSRRDKTDVGDFLSRLEQMRCRLLYRGVQAEPVNGPGYC